MVALLKESGAKNPPGSGKPGGILKGAAAQDMGGNMVSSDVGRDLWGFKQRYILWGHIFGDTSSTAQGGGGSFKNRKPIGEVTCVMHGWQSEPTDGPKGAWSCVFWSGCHGCNGHLVGHLTHNCWMWCGVVQLLL